MSHVPETLPIWEDDMDHEASTRKEWACVKWAPDLLAKRKKGYPPLERRHSSRLRAKELVHYEAISAKASRLKTMKNELLKCSKDL
jgi:hypothetical protein